MWNNQKQQKNCFPYVKLTNLLWFKLDFQKVDQHTGGKWLIHGTKQKFSCQAWNSPGEYNSRECKHDISILNTGMILVLRPASGRRCYFVTTSPIGWVQA